MKTVFVTSYHAHISRNILLTDAFFLLKSRSDLRIVLLVPDYKVDYFKKNFALPSEALAKERRVIVEGVPLYKSSKTTKGLFFKRFAEVLMPSETRIIKQRQKFYTNGKISNLLFFWAGNIFGRSFFLRRLVRYADIKLSPKGFYYDLIDKYRPDAVFANDLHNENDISLMQDAKRRGVSVIGMFRSWDNPTQSILRVFPDKLLAGSLAIASEAVRWQGYPKEKIILTGHPHYDKYLKGPTKTKEEFFREFGLDPRKRLVLFTPLGDKFLSVNDIDQYTMEALKDLPPSEAQVLVRFPPDEPVALKNFEKPANMFFHQPGFVFDKNRFEDREMRREDDESLINEIYWSDIVITGPTSINLDAAFFDKPIIASNLIPSARKYFETDYCFDFTHVQKMLGTGGAAYVQSKADLLYQIKKYLNDPKLDSEGRAEIRSLWFSHADGKAGERVAAEVFKFITLGGGTAKW